MTWEDAARELGRRPVTIVELDLDYCTKTYGVGSCPAVLGVDSLHKCYNTRKTCPVPAAYDAAARTYRFSNRELGPRTLSVPCLLSSSFTSTKIDPGKSLGIRASVTATFQDLTWDDRNLDKYLDTRTYDPETQGTFWGRLLARNPYYQNRVMRVRCGYLDDDGTVDLSKFQTHTYLINRITGPDGAGKVKVDGIDVIRLADDEKAQIPRLSKGALLAAINPTDDTLTLIPVGVGDLEYPTIGVASMDEEVVNFSRTGDVVTLNLRAAQSTVAESHEAGATFQLAKVYVNTPVADVMYEWFTDFAEADPAYFDKAAWDLECNTWLSGHKLNGTIAIPTGANALLNELVSTCLLYIWWDAIDALVKLKAIRPEDPSIRARVLTDDDSFVSDSISITEDPDQRISEVWVPYARRNPLLKLDEYRNYRTVLVEEDSDAASADEFGERKVRRIPARLFSQQNTSQALVLAARMMARYRNNPRVFKFDLDAKDADIRVGDVVEVHTRSLQNIDGSPVITNMQILKRTEKREGDLFSYEATDTFFSGRYGFIMDDSTPDYLDATEAQRNKGCFICQDDGFMPNGDPGYKII